RLDLVPQMEVKTAKVAGRDIEFSREGGHLVVELPRSKEGLRLEIEAEGAPREQFSKQRGGFLRSAVTPERTWIRNQLPWYPRVEGLAVYRIRVDAPKAWRVRTAGSAEAPEKNGDRAVWTYETSGPIRSAGLVAGPYDVIESKAGKSFVLDAWILPEGAADAGPMLRGARAAFEHYRKRFGDVAVRRFSLVEMPAAYGKGSGYSEDGYALIGCGAFAHADVPLAAHEVSHTWWGREVAFSRFAHESLATWATHGFLMDHAGAEVARQERIRAVEAVVASAAAGKEVALSDIGAYGRGMSQRSYRVHAYEKGMMLLVMLEDAIGREKLDGCLRGLVEAHRGGVVGYPDLRKALAAAGSAARTVIEQWEKPGIPRLTVEHEKKGRRVKVTVTQEGTDRPFKMTVPVVALCEKKEVRGVAKLTGRKASLTLTVPGEPEAVVLDPDYRLLVDAPRSAIGDPEAVLQAAFDVVNNGVNDPKTCQRTIRDLRSLLAGGAGKQEVHCHTLIGRLLFRLERFGEAQESLEKALALGPSPFHRRWVHLRLGCIADLKKQRKKAVEHYEKVVASGADDYQVKLARRFLEKPYRGR
ncbi:MAG: M1 family aminopeptidase, partial [Planctomycetota bacterium]